MLLLAAAAPTAAGAGEADDWFAQATRFDLGQGVRPDARVAFAWYMRAARTGLPGAEFNVAVMLDSGRGTDHDAAAAATWYARAGAHGVQRAAFNLGQLYEGGDGVPRNPELARSWFIAAGLPAARSRAARLAPGWAKDAPLTAATPVSPTEGPLVLPPGSGPLELVWTAPPPPEPARYVVEVRALDASGSHEVFSATTGLSAVLAPLPQGQGDYAWRVLTATPTAGHYSASEWVRFSLTPE